MTQEEMDSVTAGIRTKSSKIRLLAEAGVSRAEIAKYLQIRYQHVRNVLIAPAPQRQSADVEQVFAEPGEVRPLSIEEAKRGLAAMFGISPNAIEITIRG